MKTTGCIIPCYKGDKTTIKIINDALNLVDHVVLVDDCCPNFISRIVSKEIKDEKLVIIKNEFNQGIGASVKKGFNYLLSINCDIIIKIDADGQISPSLIPKIIKPLIHENAEAVKGNRFTNVDNVLSMPLLRLFGNLALSFINKLSSGYWELFDPTNGFIAFDSNSLRKIRLNKLDDRYFFESSLLFECSLANIYFKQIPMKSIYKNEISSLKPLSEIVGFSYKHIINCMKRIIYQYYILDFNAGSLELIGSMICLIISFIYYICFNYKNLLLGSIYASPGEANLLAVLLIISFQLFLSFIFFDTTQMPLLRRIKN